MSVQRMVVFTSGIVDEGLPWWVGPSVLLAAGPSGSGGGVEPRVCSVGLGLAHCWVLRDQGLLLGGLSVDGLVGGGCWLLGSSLCPGVVLVAVLGGWWGCCLRSG
jgi:hypothetical protein